MSTTTVSVDGMTCQHCVNAVTDEVTAIPGVRTVDVNLDSGRVTIDSDAPLEPGVLDRAIADAGYSIRA